MALPRLVADAASAGPGSAVFLVSAPGYGRTSVAAAVAAAAAAEGTRVAWVRLEPGDDAPGRLLRAVAESLGVEGSPDRDDLVGRWSRDGTLLVLDDVHHVTQGRTHSDLAFLTAGVPEGCRLLVTSRTEEPSVLGAAASRPLSVLDEHRLSLSDDEALTLLRGTGAAGSPSVLAIVRFCDGWPRALREAAEQLRQGAAPLEVETWLRGAGTERLLGSWWRDEPRPLQDFLIRTAILEDDLVAELCVVADGDVAHCLDELARRHSFVRPRRPGDASVWRRHPLLTELLRRRRAPASDDAERHRAVAARARRQGDVDVEVRHRMAAGDVAGAGEVALAHENRMFETGRGAVVHGWYRLLPTTTFPVPATIPLRLAWADLLTDDPASARLRLAELRSLVGAMGEGAGRRDLTGEEALLSAMLSGYDVDPRTMLDESRRAQVAFGDSFDRNAHHLAALLEARALTWLGRPQDSLLVIDRVRRRGRPSVQIGSVEVDAAEAAARLSLGYVNEARRLAASAEQAARTRADPGMLVSHSMATVTRAIADLELGRWQEARSLERAARELGEQGNLGARVFAATALARLDALTGDIRAALEGLRELRNALVSTQPSSPLLHVLSRTELEIRIEMGDGIRAERLLRSLPPSPATELAWIGLAQRRRPGSGAARLAAFRATNPRDDVTARALTVEVLALGQAGRAETALLELADLAAETGLLLALARAGDAVLQLAEKAARRSAHDSLQVLVDVAGSRRRDDAPRPLDSSPRLSRGEVELLALLPARSSNADLAQELGVSVNTIKTRLRRLYDKLGASSRDDAIGRARANGLL